MADKEEKLSTITEQGEFGLGLQSLTEEEKKQFEESESDSKQKKSK